MPYEEALQRFEREKDELQRRWREKAAAFQRYRETANKFRQILNAGHVSAVVLSKSGYTTPVPTHIWSGSEALKVLDLGRAQFAAGNSHETVEGLVLVPQAAFEAFLTSQNGESKSEASDQPMPNAIAGQPVKEPQPPGSGGGGRPPKWDWDAFWVEICRIVYLDGVPSTQAEMVRKIQEWFVQQVDAVPADSEIKKRVSKLFRVIREAENSDC